MSDEYGRDELRRVLHDRVGGFFTNTQHIPGHTCEVCAGPATQQRCGPCATHHRQYGAQLADQVLTLTYIRAAAHPRHQSEHTMWTYKQRPPVTKSIQDLSLMVLAATVLHADCVVRSAGRPWTAVTSVPSTHHPIDRHPVIELARHIHPARPEQRFLLDLGPAARDKTRTVLPDRYAVPGRYRPLVDGGHVLILDDTWVSGSNVQSAALAVRAAGATQITVLAVGRWCRTDWQPCRDLLGLCASPYDAAVCPVAAGSFPT